MRYWICLRADKTAGLFRVYIESNEIVSYEDFEYIKRECGYEWAQTVTFSFKDRQYMMLLDEEGKLTGSPINELATELYANPYDCIVGDVAILGMPKGEEMCYLSEDEATPLFEYIKAQQ